MRRPVAIILLLMLAGCNLTPAQPTSTPAPDRPGVRFLAPEDGATVFAGTDLTLDVYGWDETEGAGVAEIQVLVNGALLRSAVVQDALALPEFRVEMNWVAEGVGPVRIVAVAYRGDGTFSEEAALTVQVLPPEN
jgi:hypothetical protein